MNYLLILIGGGLGSCCRFWVATRLESSHPYFPWETLVANFFACLILGILLDLRDKNQLSMPAYWLLGTGFCGGFSTFSTFSGELVFLIDEQHWTGATVYLFGSLLLGGAGIILGLLISRTFV